MSEQAQQSTATAPDIKYIIETPFTDTFIDRLGKTLGRRPLGCAGRTRNPCPENLALAIALDPVERRTITYNLLVTVID